MKTAKATRSLRVGAIATVAAGSLFLAACSAGGGGGSTKPVDLGSGSAVSGSVKANALTGQTLTFVSYGGIYQDGQVAAAITPFGAASGAKILQDGPTDNAKLKAQVTSGNVTWDVVDTTNIFAAQQCGKVFMTLD